MTAIKALPDVRDGHNLFPISTVSEATGVPTVTLRAWERRYDFLEPHRTEKGHRLYSVQQVDLIRRVTALIDAGIPVSRVGDMIRQEKLISADPALIQSDSWETGMREMLDAVKSFDEKHLDQIYERMLTRFSDASVTQNLVIPLLKTLGDCWKRGDTGVAEEHFFSLYIRNKLGARWHHSDKPIAGRRLIIACMPGENHEFGLLFFALAARTRGFDPILLGANMPLSDIGAVVSKTKAAAVVISSTIVPGWQLIERDLRKLLIDIDVPVFVGGAGTVDMATALEAVHAIPVGAELIPGVEKIYTYLAGVRPNE